MKREEKVDTGEVEQKRRADTSAKGRKPSIVCELGEIPLDTDEMEAEAMKFCRNPRDWRCGCGH